MDRGKLSILIVGAGLGGLTAGLALARHGYEVRILERRATLSEKGGGILCRSGATRIMKTWGLEEDMESVSDQLQGTIFRDMTTGEIIMRNIAVEVSEYPEWSTTRPALQRVIHRHATAAGVTIDFNVEVVGVSENDCEAQVKLKDGRVFKADLLIAADGIRSRIRSEILAEFGKRVEPVVTNLTLYSVRLKREQLDGSPHAQALMDQASLDVAAMQIHFGRDKWVLSRAREKIYEWHGTFSLEGETDQHGLWDEDGDIEYLRDQFREAHPNLRGALDAATAIDRWKLAEVPDLPRWTSKAGGGRIILLGDSAHGMLPSAAQGYSQTVEDVGVLEFLLTSQPQVSISQNMALWESLRKPRAERAKASAAYNQQFYTGKIPPPQRGSAPAKVKSLKNTVPDRNAHLGSSAFMKWLLDHDVIEEARQRMAKPASKL